MLALAFRSARGSWRLASDLVLRAAIALGSAGPGAPARPGRLREALAIVLPAALLAWWAVPQLTWVMSPSIAAWALRPASGPIGRGDYVMFLLSHPLAGLRPVNVTKQALCLPGDWLMRIERPSPARHGARDGWYYCNGVLVGVSKPFGRNGQRLAHFGWRSGRVPRGLAYVGSRHADGFDSRYFGLVPIARLRRMVRVL